MRRLMSSDCISVSASTLLGLDAATMVVNVLQMQHEGYMYLSTGLPQFDHSS